ncbi:succinic semialdehyde dehydrogenase [Nocardia pseudobrasiliensis]|uniref:Aldehyde dehydrogenase (NAD+)/succinate-semialdehyde dehydrogenase/glutarate-semialdehyde dehydrogenase n=1 Tax=Nocardia pseudobrasiliensis TaxID=45979 RepID=A0A370I5J0_9NOCA|nr:succinic semialdehyde dehydrogenase [Nocardia pseudobrasiliensis]RDI65982.1 aldehyde dehydrogenase (NAD+)/succinate-semialdehyde dehydrogenase/glutarate-semialdehyde dehydrogenase [Nocardia pseudobrasiliensis]
MTAVTGGKWMERSAMETTTQDGTATLPPRITKALIDRLTGMVAAGAAGEKREPYEMIEVYTGKAIGSLPQSSPEDVVAAAANARAAQREWASWPLSRRLAVFEKAHELLLAEHETIAELIQIGNGKTRRMAVEESCDVPMVVSHYLKVAKRVLKPVRRGGPMPIITTSTEQHRPKGVVAVISPWNFPYAISLSDSVPALIAGNGVVLKPDNKTALCVLYGVELLYKAGLPRGLLQVVCGGGPDVGPTIIENVDFVMFTGSTATGRVIGELAGRNLIGCSLELGGKNPMIVLDDADLDDVIPNAVFAVYGNSGQACMHIERIYVADRLYDEFVRRFVAAAEELGAKAGARYDYTPEFGSLASVDHMEKVAAHVEDARAKGATVHTGGVPMTDVGPAFYAPTVLTGVTADMLHATMETFGPVATIYRYSDERDVIRQANATTYGLNASVWSKDLAHARRVADRIEAGNININDGYVTTYSSKGTPSGGVKQSGVGARHGDAGLLKYTDTVNVGVQKIQVMTARARQPFDKQLRQTLMTLRLMRKLRIR